MQKPSPNARNAGLFGGLVLVLAVLLYIQGFIVFEAEGTCYTETGVCHGIPVGNECIGQLEEKEEFDSEAQCDSLDEIKASCRSARENLCNSDDIEGGEWKEAIVDDFSCSRWDDVYGMDLKNCSN